ncbi:hypothetical protein TELCIR_18157 [Teladorsagia circumcincta]|uniref:Uncharacterized protein n=1 Tax=Teladorsagia circumcincta TaxID=45464 RepID=A0A2G9TR41_TELCI|nr:hypothetical protein TELCIR_18157 [Teladorsagia circumcincta]
MNGKGTLPDSGGYDQAGMSDEDESDYSTDDEIQYCDCIASVIAQSLPGMPGKKGIIPYEAVFDTQAQARRRGYWIPGVPVNAKIVKVERNTDRRIHLINTLLAQERVDAMLESVGIDVIPDHKEDCPYFRHTHRKKRHDSQAEFLEVSRFSFVNELGGKHTEGFVKKRPGGARVFLGWKQCCVRYFLPWSKRWLMVRDSFVAYMDHRTERIRLVLLMDKDFKVAAGGKEADGIPTGLIIFNTQQFVDARSYMSHAADMMELAREEIFIAGWWLSPEDNGTVGVRNHPGAARMSSRLVHRNIVRLASSGLHLTAANIRRHASSHESPNLSVDIVPVVCEMLVCLDITQ